jgi:hypothetical protein
MRRFGFLILVMVLAPTGWSACQAAGSYQTKPMFSEVRVVTVAMPEPTFKPLNPSAGDLLGCGRGRVRDSQTHGCRGPADIR